MTPMAVETQLLTAEELLRLPRGTWRYELLEGELRRMSPAGHTHGRVAARVTGSLSPFVEEHELGEVYAAETGFILRREPDTVRAPDVAFVTAARLRELQPAEEGFFAGAPDLAVEVVSPSDSYSEVEGKVEEWLAAGVQVVVVLDPRRQAGTVYRPGAEVRFLSAADTLALPDLFPGWSLPLARVFR
jgi:Uma2 family endonuclease